jgi:hypothetical protein
MFSRFARALAAGLAVGIVLQEGIWLALGAIDPTRSLHLEWTLGPLGEGWVVPMIASWLIGGTAAGLMAALVGGSRWHGHAAGALLCGSAGLLLTLAWPEAGLARLMALMPALGATLGAGLAGRLLPESPGRSAATADTLRAAS